MGRDYVKEFYIDNGLVDGTDDVKMMALQGEGVDIKRQFVKPPKILSSEELLKSHEVGYQVMRELAEGKSNKSLEEFDFR
ncbi:hypothetical protein GOV13_00665 [Candidatus Pacearchaeota archaeon]|nr:hypothetical protein [Candidatus Pacearchaeota archaeon]